MAVHDLTELPLNWPLAVARFERDSQDDFFPDPLHHRDVLHLAKKDIREIIELGAYEPEKAESWEVPKPNLTIRHCIHVTAIDRVVYQALVDYIADKTDPKLSDRCRAFRLRGPGFAEMFQKRVLAHKEINTEVRNALAANPAAMLVTVDIAQYFENINIEGLRSRVVDLLGPDYDSRMRASVDVLTDCLASWCPYSRRGIPQNMNPSSHLGNVFLNSIDHAMVGAGWNYWRYMDDVKLVVPDEARARIAVKTLIEQLRELELSVNSEKTGIVRPGSPKYAAFMTSDDGGAEMEGIEAAVERRNPLELETVGQQLYLIANGHLEEHTGDARRFRFALNRLTSLRRTPHLVLQEPPQFANRLIELLRTQPADTPKIRDYFAARSGDEVAALALASLLVNEPMFVYEWQNYHLWVQAALDGVEDVALVERARSALTGGTTGPEMAGAAIYLGRVGGSFDAALMRRSLQSGRYSVTVNRALCIALQRLDVGERNPLFEELAEAGGTIGVLARYLAKLPAPRYVARPRRVTLRGLIDAMPDDFS